MQVRPREQEEEPELRRPSEGEGGSERGRGGQVEGRVRGRVRLGNGSHWRGCGAQP